MGTEIDFSGISVCVSGIELRGDSICRDTETEMSTVKIEKVEVIMQ